MKDAQTIHYLFMMLAIVLEISANILMKYSQGFKRRIIGSLGIICILASFTALSQAVKGIDLSIAYALWGGCGVFLTSLAGWMLFKQKLNKVGFAGVALIVSGIVLLNLA